MRIHNGQIIERGSVFSLTFLHVFLDPLPFTAETDKVPEFGSALSLVNAYPLTEGWPLRACLSHGLSPPPLHFSRAQETEDERKRRLQMMSKLLWVLIVSEKD